MPSEPSAFEKFKQLTKKIVAVPKKEIDKKEQDWKKRRASHTQVPS